MQRAPPREVTELLYGHAFALGQQLKTTGILKVTDPLSVPRIIFVQNISHSLNTSAFVWDLLILFIYFSIFLFFFLLKLKMKRETDLFAFHSTL